MSYVFKPFWVYFCGKRVCSNFTDLPVAVQLSQHHLLKRQSFFPLFILASFVKYELAIGVWVYFWAAYILFHWSICLTMYLEEFPYIINLQCNIPIIFIGVDNEGQGSLTCYVRGVAKSRTWLRLNNNIVFCYVSQFTHLLRLTFGLPPVFRSYKQWCKMAHCFIYLLIYFNFYWSIVDLQCCANFKCTAWWVIHYIYLLF